MQLDFDRIVVRGRVGCVSFVSEKLAEEKRRFYEARKALESFGVNIILDTCENISAVYYIDRNEVSKTQRLLHQYFFN